MQVHLRSCTGDGSSPVSSAGGPGKSMKPKAGMASSARSPGKSMKGSDGPSERPRMLMCHICGKQFGRCDRQYVCMCGGVVS